MKGARSFVLHLNHCPERVQLDRKSARLRLSAVASCRTSQAGQWRACTCEQGKLVLGGRESGSLEKFGDEVARAVAPAPRVRVEVEHLRHDVVLGRRRGGAQWAALLVVVVRDAQAVGSRTGGSRRMARLEVVRG